MFSILEFCQRTEKYKDYLTIMEKWRESTDDYILSDDEIEKLKQINDDDNIFLYDILLNKRFIDGNNKINCGFFFLNYDKIKDIYDSICINKSCKFDKCIKKFTKLLTNDSNFLDYRNCMKIFNPATPPNGELSGMSSIVHLLVVPNPINLKLFNILGSRSEDVSFINYMACCGEVMAIVNRNYIIENILIKKINGNWKNKDLINFLCDDIITEKGENLETVLNKKESGFGMTQEAASKWSIEKGILKVPDPEFVIGFHVFSDNSQNFLHMHVMDKTMETKNTEHNYKKTFTINNLNYIYRMGILNKK